LGRKLAGKVKLFGLWFWRCGWHDGQHVIMEETLGVMPAERWYVYGNLIDEVISEWHSMNGGWWQQWYLTDALGSVYVLTDNSGDVVEAYHYSIYGSPKVYASDGTPRGLTNYDNRILFTSREYLWQLHLYFYRARWYVPSIGGFASPDPAKHARTYVYVEDSPTYATDPSGAILCVKSQQRGVLQLFIWLLVQCGLLQCQVAKKADPCPTGYERLCCKAVGRAAGRQAAFQKVVLAIQSYAESKGAKGVVCYRLAGRGGRMGKFGLFAMGEQTIYLLSILQAGARRCELLLHELFEQFAFRNIKVLIDALLARDEEVQAGTNIGKEMRREGAFAQAPYTQWKQQALKLLRKEERKRRRKGQPALTPQEKRALLREFLEKEAREWFRKHVDEKGRPKRGIRQAVFGRIYGVCHRAALVAQVYWRHGRDWCGKLP